jgi:type I restriction enzyme R subunit
MLNEADTRVKLIDPKLHEGGWKEEQILRERPITVGRILDEDGNRGAGKKADYVLLFSSSFPLAVVEAKDESHTALDGVQQAKSYAKDLDVLFAYSTNGHQIEEFDRFSNKQQTLASFPSPEELWKKYFEYRLKDAKIPSKNPLEIPLPVERGKEPRYYQEIAVKSVVESVLKGNKRILLTMATGTGKTHVAFWTVWKLYNSGLIRRILYIADRIVLRDQAYNWFGHFGDARAVIGEGNVPKNRDIFFSTYQSLYSEVGSERVFQLYDPDFFDVIIIDECHRSGFGTWHDILKHFTKAIHLGMTATPKRDENIDTYAYFGNPVYSYSLGKGIEDGFLAPYKIHKVRTNIDKQGGLSIKDIEAEGVKVYIPDETRVKDWYTSGEFERQLLLPDRTVKICEHLAKLLRVFEPMQKTMVFCVNNDHAALVTKELQNRFSDLGYSDYAVRIVSEEAEAREILERFVDSDKKTPVCATTVDLLTTGVDAPCVHNIVFLRTINSKVLFKQIIGRGSRIDPNTDKYYFRIIDYLNATRLLDPWDYPEDEDGSPVSPKGPFDWFLKGKIIDKETGEPVANASVIVSIAPNQTAHIRTDENGFFKFSDLPHSRVGLKISATGYVRKEFEAKPTETLETSLLTELKKEAPAKEKIVVEGLTIYIADETYVEIEEGKPLAKAKYVEYSKDEVKKRVVSLADLQRIWLNSKERESFLEELKKISVNPEVLAKLIERPDADTFDVLARITFDAPIITRDERARALMNLKSGFLESFGPEAKEVLLMLLEKYRAGGVGEITPKVFSVPPFDKKGYILGIAKAFGGLDKLKKAITEVQKGLYLDFGNSIGGK